MIKITCQVDTYNEPAKPSIKIHAHWNEPEKVVIEYDDIKLTVVAKDIITAIYNCTNTAKF